MEAYYNFCDEKSPVQGITELQGMGNVGSTSNQKIKKIFTIKKKKKDYIKKHPDRNLGRPKKNSQKTQVTNLKRRKFDVDIGKKRAIYKCYSSIDFIVRTLAEEDYQIQLHPSHIENQLYSNNSKNSKSIKNEDLKKFFHKTLKEIYINCIPKKPCKDDRNHFKDNIFLLLKKEENDKRKKFKFFDFILSKQFSEILCNYLKDYNIISLSEEEEEENIQFIFLAGFDTFKYDFNDYPFKSQERIKKNLLNLLLL